MSQYFTPAELADMTEQELRSLHSRLLSDLRRNGQSAFLSPGVYASLQNIEAAIVALRAKTFALRKPKGPKV